MKNNNRNFWYVPLSAQFELIENAMPLRCFAAVEAVLYLLSLIAPDDDPAKAYLLFTQYQLIGATQCSPMEHVLQQARFKLGYYRSRKYWEDDLREYQKQCYDAVRAFSIQEAEGKRFFSKTMDSYPYPYEARKKEWTRFWSEDVKNSKLPSYAEDGTYRYTYPNLKSGDFETVHIKLERREINPVRLAPMQKNCRSPINISLKELLAAAEKMAEICPGDPCHTILKTNILKKIEGSAVQPSSGLTIHEVVNIVGMVGSGKSTLIKVLSFWCHQHGFRIAVIVDTVAETLSLQKYLSSLGIEASPLVGRSERLKYINQVSRPGGTCLPAAYSQYLTPMCLVDGMDEQHDEAIVFGKEPCYSLKKGEDENYLCPYFGWCLGTKMLRDCYTASVVVTTVAGFAAARVGSRRETFLELAMRDFDLVVFDESDRAQKALDHLFMPETSFDDYIHECADDCGIFMKQSSWIREEDPAAQRYNEMQRQSVTVMSCIIKALHHELGDWRKIAQGDHFSALTLLDNLYQEDTEYKIPYAVYKEIYDLIDMQDEDRILQSTLWTVLESSCKNIDDSLFNQLYHRWLREIGPAFPRPEKDRARNIQDARIKLILKLIYFDHFIRGLGDAYEACHETSYGQNELFSFLQTRFRPQQHFLPSALCGNLFGLKKTDREDIILFRQFAFGRSLMKDLPYLRTDMDGNPAGPHVILLSGSSWAEGSYEYHVNRPVNYILEADAEKRKFLEKTRFFESGFSERISGTGDDERMSQLRTVTQKTVDLIVREYKRKAGKILLVVNSYNQACEVQQTLQTALRKVNCPARVCRMISDAISIPGDEDTVRRGEVSRFAQMKAEILIAPAMAIERGHNIVDEYGHSALASVFFMVRPMAVPDDIQQKGSKLNGLVESHCKREPQESLLAYNARIRQYATQQWARMNKTKAFGLADLDENERKDVVATLFILILQIFGRLARVTDTARPAPHVYFIDGAFRRRPERPEDFDCLSELGKYLENLMTQKESAEIAETLYAPFYHAYRKDIHYEQ